MENKLHLVGTKRPDHLKGLHRKPREEVKYPGRFQTVSLSTSLEIKSLRQPSTSYMIHFLYIVLR